ncbi:MAG: deoxyxylulose-5-phosphate synthase [Candidatus Krumholzibacteriia bacterium]
MLEWSALAELERDPQVRLLGIPDAFQEHASRAELLAGLGLDTAGIAASIRKTITGSVVGDSRAQSAS